MVLTGSGPTHGWPTPGPAGEQHLEFGGAALTTSSAAQRRVCSPFVCFAARVTWLVALVYLFAIAPVALPRENSHAGASSSAHSYLFSTTFDYPTGKEVTEDHSAALPQAAAQQ